MNIKRLIIAALLACFAVVIMPLTSVNMQANAASNPATVNQDSIKSYFNSQVGQIKLSGYCLKFCDDGYETLGFDNHNFATAKDMANSYSLNKSKNPPVGAYVFWNGVRYGHVGISVGDGIVATQGQSGDTKPIAKKSVDDWCKDCGTYLGWCIPRGLTVSGMPVTSGNAEVRLDEGDYIIQSKAPAPSGESMKVLDVEGGSLSNDANIQVVRPYGNNSQIFHVARNYSINSTTISLKASGLYVSTYGDYNSNSNAIQFQGNGGKGQNWILEDAGGGYVYVRNLWGYYLDVAGGYANDCTNVQVHSFNGSDAQKWKFVKVSGKTQNQIASGYYIIHSNANTQNGEGKKLLDITGGNFANDVNAQVVRPYGNNAQIFKIGWNNNIYATTISMKDSKKYLSTYGDYNRASNVIQFQGNGSFGQNWHLEKAEGRYYYICNLWGYYLDVDGGVAKDCTNVQVYPFKGSNSQKWTLTKVSGITQKRIKNGEYSITSKNGRKLEVINGSNTTCAEVITSKNPAVDTSTFKLVWNGNLYSTTILLKGSDKYISTLNNANASSKVTQASGDGSYGQNWHLEYLDDGYCYIRNQWGFYLAAPNKDSEEQNVKVETFKGTDNQKWKVEKTNNTSKDSVTEKCISHTWDDGKVTTVATTSSAGVRTYTCSVCMTTKTEKIHKHIQKKNPLSIKGKTAKIKNSKLKKKPQTLTVSKVIKFTRKGQGKMKYKLISAKKGKKSYKKYFKINKKTGKVTIKKNRIMRKGTYKVRVKVKAAGNTKYRASAWKTVTFKIKVK